MIYKSIDAKLHLIYCCNDMPYFTAPPVVRILWLYLESSSVNLTWELLSGEVEVLQLRHNNFTQNPEMSDSVSLQSTNISQWEILKDDIMPTETSVYVTHEFDQGLYNSFVIIPFEDEFQQINNQIFVNKTYIVIYQPGEAGI